MRPLYNKGKWECFTHVGQFCVLTNEEASDILAHPGKKFEVYLNFM